MRFKAIVLDMDGTLIDSSEAHLKAWSKAAEILGVYISEAKIKSEFGKSSYDMAKAFLPRSRIGDFIQFAELKDEIFMKNCLDLVKPISGVADAIREFKMISLKTAVASSNPRKLIVRVLDLTGLLSYIDVIIGAEDVKRGKPHPDIIKEAVKRLDVESYEAIYVGDTVYDVEAGRAAGVFTVAVLTGVASREELESSCPDMIVESLKYLLETLTVELP
ncbi:HAD family phosphatase [Candidatus Bathyarchaeota archaeon]|nr:HAD family phosphatase [Candidatus Bathyarchaeota archaeon]MBS7612645.1 HAD family phosphatase [Candidatus Bathyarchaeota archaeon]MBS7617228.1 HAD family phosphatase [Candidatus Bathyarchaeota archaeon]